MELLKNIYLKKLIPLDVESIVTELKKVDFTDSATRDLYVKQILSKYGTTPQKKWTRLEVWEYFWIKITDKIDDIEQKKWDMNLWTYSFLKDHWLLEE